MELAIRASLEEVHHQESGMDIHDDYTICTYGGAGPKATTSDLFRSGSVTESMKGANTKLGNLMAQGRIDPFLMKLRLQHMSRRCAQRFKAYNEEGYWEWFYGEVTPFNAANNPYYIAVAIQNVGLRVKLHVAYKFSDVILDKELEDI
ncbi:hypothetical protein AMTR_s00013p00218720 [Amborella trichopoda]|uniref:Uncharacterized protein n=1 Tax=Amborella trichopoda TaxID=13333 RepID=W1PJ10_AMBTC|nr:hypothetical protein AMTR_s00013p00218720 [Amborella trichopoda]